MNVIKAALEETRNKAPEVAKKFMWGETGVAQEDPEMILAALGNMQSGDALVSLIVSAVRGVDVNAAAGQNTQVAATMRSTFGKLLANELKANPEGDLAVAVKELLAPDVANALTESLKAVFNGSQADPAGSSAPFGMDEFEPGEGDPLAAEIPTNDYPR